MTSESLSRSRPPQAVRFRRLAAIGHGGMADVFLASARGVGGTLKLLVLKQLRPALARDPEYRAMFQREARIAALLSHPNVVQTYEVGSEDGLPFIAMEYLEGQPLHRVLRRLHRPPPEPRALPLAMHLRLIAELLAGLHYVHELRDLGGAPLGLVHRDVTPHNVLVTYDGQIKLVDFGIARVGAEDTGVGCFKGKVAYTSPEQLRGGALDRRSDLFAVGVMLWEALTRQRLWPGLDDIAIARRLEDGDIPPLPAHVRCAPALRALCESALAPAPERRPATAEAFRAALEACLVDLERTSPREVGALIAAAFADDRAALRDQVEQQIRIARDEEPPLLDLSEQTGMTSAPDPDGECAHPDEPTRPDGLSDHTADPAAGPAVPHESTWSGPLVPEPAAPAPPRWPAWLAGAAVVAAGTYMAFRTGSMEHAPKDMSSAPDRCSGARPIVELSGDIEYPARLTCDKIYRLRAATVVRPGASLTIEPGTIVVGDRATHGLLLVQPGAQLLAEGTRERPIVFTSERAPGERRPGDWGGVVVLGRAPTGLRDADGRPTTGRVEGVAAGGEYGGPDPEDSSGVLRFVRIEYAGTELAPNNETNGLTLAGVGRGTVVDHVQVRRPADDCFAFFGGTVDAKHLICQDPGDDGFDWDLGWSGRLQFILLRAGAEPQGTAAALEGDDPPLTSAPAIFNATLCGRGRALAREHYGALLRRGAAATLGNAIVLGFAAALDVRDPGTSLDPRPGLWLARNFAAALAYPEIPGGAGPLADDDAGLDEAALLTPVARLADPDLPGCADPTGPGPYKPPAPLEQAAAAPPDDGFFDPSARFAGAFRDQSDAWDAGWAVWSDS